MNTAVSYEDSDRTLVLDVLSDFNPGDSLTISGLKYSRFNSQGASGTPFIGLRTVKGGVFAARDSKTVTLLDGAMVSSADYQKFLEGQADEPISPLTITEDDLIKTIKSSSDIRIHIHDDINILWDTSDTTATVTGGAAAKVGTTVSYEDSGKTLVIDVLSDFSLNETITLSDLSFTGFTSGSVINRRYMWLETDNLGTLSTSDDKSISLTTGGTIVSASKQNFVAGQLPAAISPITIKGDSLISSANDIRISTGGGNLKWDPTDTSATVSGSASGKVSATVLYEDGGATLVVDVTSDFAIGDSITLSDLSFNDFIYGGSSSTVTTLDLEIDNAGNSVDSDSRTITVEKGAVILSSAPQSFFINAPPTLIKPITITEHATTGTITSDRDIRIRIPAGLDTIWTIGTTSMTVSGTGASKVSSTVAFEDSDKTLVIDVLADFLPGESITISNLKMERFFSGGSGWMALEVDNRGGTSSDDEKQITLSDILISSQNDLYLVLAQGVAPMSPATITGGTGVTAANDIRIYLPGLMKWVTTVSSANIQGPAASKVSSAVTYDAGDSVVVLDVLSDFAAGDSFTLSGLVFDISGTFGGSGSLSAGAKGPAASFDASDDKVINIAVTVPSLGEWAVILLVLFFSLLFYGRRKENS